ncbi:MAG: hypothetical protein WAZ18_07140 [Alphaproteobacteria bacterium]
MLVFILPAAWLAYVLGRVVREGLAAVLYYRLADVTPVFLDNWDRLVWWSVVLGVVANGVVLMKIHYGKWLRVMLGYPLGLVGGAAWLTAALLRPEWTMAPLQGLGGFTAMMTIPVAATMAHVSLRDDELVRVLGWMAVFCVMVGALHLMVMLWLG